MMNILAHAQRKVLEQFTWSNVLLAFDYDGTLAPIVVDPDAALMRQRTRALLQTATKSYPVVVISGRAQRDAQRMLRGIPVLEVIGNHGVEPRHVTDRLLREVGRWHPILDDCLRDLKGVRVEDKLYSVAVHYRQSREKKRARAAILEAAALLGNVRVIGGKQVFNILPEGAAHKGLALERERERLGCDTAIYVGDDETDEDVFTLDQPGRLLAIRVGRKPSSAAKYYVSGQRAMDHLLRVLIELRRDSQPRPRAAR